MGFLLQLSWALQGCGFGPSYHRNLLLPFIYSLTRLKESEPSPRRAREAASIGAVSCGVLPESCAWRAGAWRRVSCLALAFSSLEEDSGWGVGLPTSRFNLHFHFYLKGLDGDDSSELQTLKRLPAPNLTPPA